MANHGERVVRRWIGMALGAALAIGLSGCGDSAGRLDRLEEDTPQIRKALERKRLGDEDGAIELYRKALDKDPTLARAHLELGFLLDHPTRDYVLAIYHYRRYLEIRPGTDKKEMLEDRIRMAKLALAASLTPTTSSGAERMMTYEKENATLRQENDYLRNELADLRERMRRTEQPPSVAVTAGTTLVKIVPVPAPPLGASDIGAIPPAEEGPPIVEAAPPEPLVKLTPVKTNAAPRPVNGTALVKPVPRPSPTPTVKNPTPPRPVATGKVKQYKVQKGDTLEKIEEFFPGRPMQHLRAFTTVTFEFLKHLRP